jgi:hypothetical protein
MLLGRRAPKCNGMLISPMLHIASGSFIVRHSGFHTIFMPPPLPSPSEWSPWLQSPARFIMGSATNLNRVEERLTWKGTRGGERLGVGEGLYLWEVGAGGGGHSACRVAAAIAGPAVAQNDRLLSCSTRMRDKSKPGVPLPSPCLGATWFVVDPACQQCL